MAYDAFSRLMPMDDRWLNIEGAGSDSPVDVSPFMSALKKRMGKPRGEEGGMGAAMGGAFEPEMAAGKGLAGGGGPKSL